MARELKASELHALPGPASRSEQVASQIRNLIETGHFKPGDKLPSERDLAAHLNVARGSLREAIRSLAAIGLVEARWGQGVFVREVDLTQANQLIDAIIDPRVKRTVLQELLELRKLIEPQAAAWAAERATDRERSQFNDWCRQSTEAAASGLSPQVAEALDERLHALVAQASHNRALLRTTGSLLDLLQASRRRARRLPGRVEQSTQEHEQICRSIIAGNPPGAREAMLTHILSVERSMAHGSVTPATQAV